MRILITGANRGLGLKLTESFLDDENKLYLTARNIESIKKFEIENVEVFEIDLNSLDSINTFFNTCNQIEELDLIVHCASPFEGTLKDSSYEDLDIWGNAYLNALKLSKLAAQKLKNTGKLILIGSVVGNEGRVSKSCVPYSVYKGSLKLLAEGFQKEFGKTAIYLNLGGFRDEKTDEYLQTEDVISAISNLSKIDYKNSVYNLMSKMDESTYL